MAIGKCLKCDKIAPMTQDHVFPKWLRKAVTNFGIKLDHHGDLQLLCNECNGKKGGNLDYSDEITRMAVKTIITKLITEVRKHEEFTP